MRLCVLLITAFIICTCHLMGCSDTGDPSWPATDAGNDAGTDTDTDTGDAEDCVPEEGTGYAKEPDVSKCCGDLAAIPGDFPAQGSCLDLSGMFYCTKCGDGICSGKVGGPDGGVGNENRCNCSRDCK
jgi:hypothetical protein